MKIFEEVRAEKFANMGRETLTQLQEAQSSMQDKPKEEQRDMLIKLTTIKEKI